MRSTVAVVLLYLGLAMGVVGGLGLAFDWGTDDEPAVASPAGPLPAAAPSTSTAAPSVEQPEAFFELFTGAVSSGDRAFLLERLHPAVTERYGREQCRDAVRQLLDPEADLRLVTVQPPKTYEYDSDGQITMVAGTRTFVVDGTVAGQTGPREYHFATAGGRYRIFLDCGELRTGG